MSSELDMRKMEWLWHVDMPFDAHPNADSLAKTARVAWDFMKDKVQPGDTLVMVVVRPPK